MQIGLVLNRAKPGIPEAVEKLGIIADRVGCFLLLTQRDAERIPAGRGIQVCDERSFFDRSELLLAVGGDGTVLKAARYSLRRNVPVAGINLGRLGFLSTLKKGEENRLEELLRGDFIIQKRHLICAQKEGGPVYTAFNELCFQRETADKLPEFSVAADGCDLGGFRADGLIFATPTGSTAYSLAAGGPIAAPDVRCMILTPICPFNERRQSIIFSEESSIALAAHIKPGSHCTMMADGRNPIPVENGEIWNIRMSDQEVRLVQMYDSRFFRTCANKIWGDA